MKNLDEIQKEIAVKIFSELVGQTVSSAKDILKVVAVMLNEGAVVQKGGGDFE